MALSRSSPGDGSLDSDDFNSLCLGTGWLVCQPAHVVRVAGEQNRRSWLGKRYHGKERVEGAPVARQPGAAEKLACCAALLLVNGDHRHSGEDAVHASILRSTAEDLGERRSGGHHSAAPIASSLDPGKGSRMVGCQFGQSLGIENQGAPYLSS
jgi:hypothetical protein